MQCKSAEDVLQYIGGFGGGGIGGRVLRSPSDVSVNGIAPLSSAALDAICNNVRTTIMTL